MHFCDIERRFFDIGTKHGKFTDGSYIAVGMPHKISQNETKMRLFLMNCHSLSVVLFLNAILLLAAGASAQNLYVSDYSSGNLYELTPSGVETTNATGLGHPIGLAFDSKGDVFIANFGGSSIIEINSAGARSTNATGLSPAGLAFDRNGNLFVANYMNNNIIEFTSGGSSNVFASGLGSPAGLAFDKVGDLYEADAAGNRIIEFTNNNGTLSPNTNIFASGLDFPTGLAFDAHGNLFESDNGSGAVNEFTNNNGTLFANTNIFATGIYSPWQLAIDSLGNLFVSTGNGQSIQKFAPNGTKTAFGSGFTAPYGVAFVPNAALRVLTATNKTCLVSVSMPSPYCLTVVQASTNFSNWTPVLTNTPPFTFTDSAANTFPRRLFRAFVWQ